MVSVGMSFAPSICTRISVFQERTVQTNVVDNFDGAVGLVVVGFDWRRGWQLDTPATGRSAGRLNPATDYRPPSRQVGRKLINQSKGQKDKCQGDRPLQNLPRNCERTAFVDGSEKESTQPASVKND